MEKGAVFSDPLALQIAGETADVLATEGDKEGEKGFRLFMAIRSRIVEDKLAEAVQRGIRQAVVMGGGVDTLGLRNPHVKSGLTVFEVDRPLMQDWKRSHLTQLGLSVPQSLTFVPVDFEQDNLRSCLIKAGFDLAIPAFFSWLGVVPYLTQEAIENTLRFVASLSGSEIVFDYGEPLENYEGSHRQLMEERSAFVASVGEPWLSRFNPQDMHAILQKCGLNHFIDYDRAGISSYFGWPIKNTNTKASPHVVDAFSASGCHLGL
ncbi:O-Methyltransferase [Acetobacter orleanensis NRIC 0473]|uniref:S-adenosyl-L-methionine-dependent methyltransferase n=1 Tax=Acetobacter orleanensis TaxID=104099 RepID=A0A4Y3TP60_9PROT|nr:S-adenosyl-L-methionine-dependent methyltransferase yktD [Acetobacter orleanensis JCM 7639]GBR29666.1 O-Methyltransferase [Acetobacter orleanensis NRIC 0473]GEB82780.1 S-adenosyl-L-methionine-dependent methyltransferase [Acetobacter orleanensis]